MLKINKPIQTDNSYEYVFEDFSIRRGVLGRCFANWVFRKVGANGETLGRVEKSYQGDSFVELWDNFNSLKFLYEECLKEEGIEDVEVPTKIDEQFTKPVLTKIDEVAEAEFSAISK